MRGRTRGMVAVAITSLALVATACGGGGTEPEPGAEDPAGQAGGEIVVAGCTPKNPLIPGNTSEACGGDIIDAMTSKLVQYNTENAAPENDIAESIETTDNKTFTVKLKPATSSTTGPRSRRRTSSTPGTTPRTDPTARPAATSTPRSRATPTCSAPTHECKQKPKAKTMSGPEGGRRHDLHHPDHGAGVQPAGPARLLGIRAAARLLLRRPEGLREEADRCRAVQDGLDQQHRVRALQVRRLLRRHPGERGQADLPDLSGSGGRLRRRRGGQPRLHRREQHPAGPVHRRRLPERLPRPLRPSASPAGSRWIYVLLRTIRN